MSIEVEVLSEVYTILKQYIPAKDRQEAADNVMSVLVDMLSDEELEDLAATDSFLTKAWNEYNSDLDDDVHEIDED